MKIRTREEMEETLKNIGVDSEIAFHEKENFKDFLNDTEKETDYEEIYMTTWIRYRSLKYDTFEDFDYTGE